MVPSDKDVLIGSRCLSCNRPLGGFGATQAPKGIEEWYTGAGGLGGPKDRILEARGGGSGSGEVDGKSGGVRGSGGAGIASSRSPGRTQPTVTPAKILPADSASSEGSGVVPKKGPQGPLLFERTGAADGAGAQLKGRVLRGGGGGGGSVSTEGNVSISKVTKFMPQWWEEPSGYWPQKIVLRFFFAGCNVEYVRLIGWLPTLVCCSVGEAGTRNAIVTIA